MSDSTFGLCEYASPNPCHCHIVRCATHESSEPPHQHRSRRVGRYHAGEKESAPSTHRPCKPSNQTTRIVGDGVRGGEGGSGLLNQPTAFGFQDETRKIAASGGRRRGSKPACIAPRRCRTHRHPVQGIPFVICGRKSMCDPRLLPTVVVRSLGTYRGLGTGVRKKKPDSN